MTAQSKRRLRSAQLVKISQNYLLPWHNWAWISYFPNHPSIIPLHAAWSESEHYNFKLRLEDSLAMFFVGLSTRAKVSTLTCLIVTLSLFATPLVAMNSLIPNFLQGVLGPHGLNLPHSVSLLVILLVHQFLLVQSGRVIHSRLKGLFPKMAMSWNVFHPHRQTATIGPHHSTSQFRQTKSISFLEETMHLVVFAL